MIVMFGFDGWLAASFESKMSPEGNMWHALIFHLTGKEKKLQIAASSFSLERGREH